MQITCLLHASIPPSFCVEAIESLADGIKGATTAASNLKPPTVKLILVLTSLSASQWDGVSAATSLKVKKQHFCMHDGSMAPNLMVLDPEVASTVPETL